MWATFTDDVPASLAMAAALTAAGASVLLDFVPSRFEYDGQHLHDPHVVRATEFPAVLPQGGMYATSAFAAETRLTLHNQVRLTLGAGLHHGTRFPAAKIYVAQQLTAAEVAANVNAGPLQNL